MQKWQNQQITPKTRQGWVSDTTWTIYLNFSSMILHRTSLVQWKRWHHRLNVWTLRELEFDPCQCQTRTNVIQCCVKFSSHCLYDCCEIVRWAVHSPLQISNPSETRGSFFEKVISTRRILVPLHFFVTTHLKAVHASTTTLKALTSHKKTPQKFSKQKKWENYIK